MGTIKNWFFHYYILHGTSGPVNQFVHRLQKPIYFFFVWYGHNCHQQRLSFQKIQFLIFLNPEEKRSKFTIKDIKINLDQINFNLFGFQSSLLCKICMFWIILFDILTITVTAYVIIYFFYFVKYPLETMLLEKLLFFTSIEKRFDLALPVTIHGQRDHTSIIPWRCIYTISRKHCLC